MRINTVTVQVAGKSYQLSGAEEPAHFERLAALADRRINETALQNPGLNAETCAVAAALSIADDLVKAQILSARLREELEKYRQTIDES